MMIVKINNDIEIVVKKTRERDSNASSIAIRSVINGNESYFEFFSKYDVVNNKPRYERCLSGWGLSDDEMNKVTRTAMEVLESSSCAEVENRISLKQLRVCINNGIRARIPNDGIIEKKDKFFIKSILLREIVEEIEGCGCTFEAVMKQLQLDGFLENKQNKENKENRNGTLKRFGSDVNGRRAYCIKKEREFADSECLTGEEYDEEGGVA